MKYIFHPEAVENLDAGKNENKFDECDTRTESLRDRSLNSI
ncbi:hypothetical protein [Brunnivagina elsteri]|nr:hypothetical protein [Calothrix elsteri]